MGMPERRGDKDLLGSHCLNHYPRRVTASERSKFHRDPQSNPLLTTHPISTFAFDEKGLII